jgi:hypothetical protein
MRRLAMPFVATLVVTGCTKGEGSNITPLPPAPTKTTTPDNENPPAPKGELIYDGYGGCYRMVDGEKKYAPKCPDSLLPEAGKDALVYQRGDVCQQTPDGKTVRCPAGGPTVILPEPSSTKVAGKNVSLRFGSLDCHSYVDHKCPPNVACNPPPPEPITCPPELMPKLAGGAKPTKVDGARCFFGKIEVACPK